ncbi:hypothetical protein G6F42_018110 [Rhizopus arrhizus]|nr:hypothetical protein G6F42_018110 [Rhizopus arrhizus]
MYIDKMQNDLVVAHDLELQYNPKLFVNTKESLQMTLKLFKDRIYYTAYIDDLEALVELCQATKGDKISATEVQVNTKLYHIDASLHNTGASLDYTVDMLKLQAMQADVDDKIALKRNVTEEARLRLFDLVKVMKTDNNL